MDSKKVGSAWPDFFDLPKIRLEMAGIAYQLQCAILAVQLCPHFLDIGGSPWSCSGRENHQKLVTQNDQKPCFSNWAFLDLETRFCKS